MQPSPIANFINACVATSVDRVCQLLANSAMDIDYTLSCATTTVVRNGNTLICSFKAHSAVPPSIDSIIAVWDTAMELEETTVHPKQTVLSVPDMSVEQVLLSLFSNVSTSSSSCPSSQKQQLLTRALQLCRPRCGEHVETIELNNIRTHLSHESAHISIQLSPSVQQSSARGNEALCIASPVSNNMTEDISFTAGSSLDEVDVKACLNIESFLMTLSHLKLQGLVNAGKSAPESIPSTGKTRGRECSMEQSRSTLRKQQRSRFNTLNMAVVSQSG